jgi:hypothetical protein
MDYATEFTNQFCTQLALNERGLRHMHAFYVFEDKREGSLVDRYTRDAAKFWEVHTQLYPKGVQS